MLAELDALGTIDRSQFTVGADPAGELVGVRLGLAAACAWLVAAWPAALALPVGRAAVRAAAAELRGAVSPGRDACLASAACAAAPPDTQASRWHQGGCLRWPCRLDLTPAFTTPRPPSQGMDAPEPLALCLLGLARLAGKHHW
jgi:hypothetical protein